MTVLNAITLFLFATAGTVSLGVIVATVLPQWRRIVELLGDRENWGGL